MKNKLMSINIRKVDAASYLKRIGYRGPLTPHIDVLRRMHHRHLLTVPFENLDIHVGRPIILDERFFYEKIVENRRGGYCYELNGCFAWLLKRLGFKVSMLSARVARKEGGFSPDFDHLTLLVRLGERWLVDVGFGDLFTEPKRLDSAVAQQDKGEVYRIVSKGDEATVTPERGRNYLEASVCVYSAPKKARRLRSQEQVPADLPTIPLYPRTINQQAHSHRESDTH